MAPKKKHKAAQTRPAGRAGSAQEARTRRTPVVLEERSPWPVVVWIALVLVWALGTPLFLLFVMAEGFALVGAQEVTAQARRTVAGYLLGMLVCALMAPLAGAVAALVLRRRIAAVLFGAVLLISLIGMWVLAPPWENIAAIWSGFQA